jgi:hypothetical protein
MNLRAKIGSLNYFLNSKFSNFKKYNYVIKVSRSIY